jgi:parvulin-like peptidyl-prolyl isomerase
VSDSAALGAFSMMRHTSLVLLLLVATLALAACGGGGNASLSSGDVATVASQKITKDDLTALLNRAKKSYEADKRPFPKPGTSAYNTLQSQAIAFLLQRAEFAAKAKSMGIDISDTKIDDRIKQLKKQFYGGSDKRYKDTLEKQGLSEDQAREEVRAQLISEALYKKVTSSVHVSDAAIAQYYKQNKSVYQQKESRDIRHILVNKKSLADDLYAQLVASHEKNFAALAKRFSKDPGSAANGGRLTITRGQTVPPFDKAAFQLRQGELSSPVKTQYGWHIIQALSAIRPPSVTSLDKVKSSIRQQLEQQKKNELMTKWVDDTKKDFCKPGKIKYKAGYQPTPDPCAALAGTTSTSRK